MATHSVDIHRTSIDHLVAAADLYATSSPAVTRCLLAKAESLKKAIGVTPTPNFLTCPKCGTLFRGENQRVRVTRRPQRTHLIKRLEKKQERGERLGKLAQKLLDRYLQMENKQVITCLTCMKKIKLAFGRKPEEPSLVEMTPQPLKLSKSQKKKLRRKEKAASLDDSGYGTSAGRHLDNTSSILRHPQLTSTPLSHGANKSSLPQATPPNPFTSLLKTKTSSDGRRHDKRFQPLHKKESALSKSGFLKQALQSPGPETTTINVSASQTKKKNKKDKGVHNILKKMINDEKAKKTKTDNSLQSFLSSL